MAEADDLLVLDLSHNKLSDIPFAFLVRVTDLHFLNLSHNQLKTLPPQFRRLAQLRYLNLSYNPLKFDKLTRLGSLDQLVRLELRGTHRSGARLPVELTDLPHLRELDVADN
eukprot:TRINITY_DN12484_c4_g1_i1.p2 TRINITY_DN12484_c4_g1~~TRINITY_DN12484_c4_g1_i1.p2  ORF type:complete len:122 (+),score=44.49 TRINITY_DN12484_c4_g1_i1:32-367(+)